MIMKTWICTNLANYLGPQQGPARLYAYLKKQRLDVTFKDYNKDAYLALLSSDLLGQNVDRLKGKIDSAKRSTFLREDIGSLLLHSSGMAMKQLLAKGIMLDSRWYRYIKNSGIVKQPLEWIIRYGIKYDNIFYALLSQQKFIVAEVDKANKALDEEFLSLPPDKFISHYRTLLCGKAIIDAAYFPAQLDFGLGFHGTAFNPSIPDILNAINNENHNFLLPFFRQRVIPQITQERPGLVGISVSHPSELVPAFTLAKIIKSCHPEAHICLGGASVTEIEYRIVKNPPLWDLFDSLISGPGEVAFSELIDTIDKKGDLGNVPNLVYKEKGALKKSGKLHEFDINEACTPEYVGIRPRSGIPLETSSGCYWGKCIYCYYPQQGTANHNADQQQKRVRKIELVLEDFRILKERYNPIYIGITDSCIHPQRIMAICEQNRQSEKKVNFSAFIRFEKEFKSPEFCRKLAAGGFLGGQIGLESGSQRVNDIINKGVDVNDAVVILKNLHKAGILVHLYTMIGLPGEKREEAMMTYEFLKRWHRLLTLNWQIYSIYVLENSPLAMRAAEFGIRAAPLPDEYLVEAMRYTIDQELTQASSTTLSILINEKLKRFLHPLNKIMDIESVKLFLLAQKTNGIKPGKIKI
jgi:hypothetical protein